MSLCNGVNVSSLSHAIEEHRNTFMSHDQQAPPSNTTEGTTSPSPEKCVKSHDQQAPPSPPFTPAKVSVESAVYRDFVRALTNETVLSALMQVILDKTT